MSKLLEATAVVLFSGGQDSVTLLGWALNRFDKVVAVSFDYGQRHKVELEAGERICKAMNVERHVFRTDILTQLGDSALVGTGDVKADHRHKKGLPASYVPNRNAFMITTAHALAQKIGAEHLVSGVCQTDYSGYPDCRADFISKMEAALNEGSESSIMINTPLMYLDKAQTFSLAETEGMLDFVIEDSVTCYEGDIKVEHEWGRGCGTCPSCTLRKDGYERFVNGDYEMFVADGPRQAPVKLATNDRCHPCGETDV